MTKNIDATSAEKAVYHDKTNILFSVRRTFSSLFYFCVNTMMVVC